MARGSFHLVAAAAATKKLPDHVAPAEPSRAGRRAPASELNFPPFLGQAPDLRLHELASARLFIYGISSSGGGADERLGPPRNDNKAVPALAAPLAALRE